MEDDPQLTSDIDPHGQPGAAPANDMIPLRSADTTQLVPSSTVRWIETHGDQVRLHTTEGVHHGTIPATQGAPWSWAHFMHIHESFVVPPQLITELKMCMTGYSVVVGDHEKELPVGRHYVEHLKERLARPWDTA